MRYWSKWEGRRRVCVVRGGGVVARDGSGGWGGEAKDRRGKGTRIDRGIFQLTHF